MNVELIIPVLTGFAVIALGGAMLIARAARRAPLQKRLRLAQAGPGMIPAHSDADDGTSLTDMVESIGSAVSSKTSLTLRQQLTQAGYHDRRAAGIYVGAKLIMFIIGALAAGSLVLTTKLQPHSKMLLTVMFAAVLFFIPNLILAARRSSRCREIRRHLPDAIDLLEICASAGMGLDMAWNSVTEEVRSVSHTLADEMALTNLEIHLGAGRAAAMRNMAQRTGAVELSSLVAVIVQSERFGTSITDALRTYAASMREARSHHAQESAEKLAVKLIFPMVVFIFPAVVMVMAGPGFMTLYRALRPR